MDETNFSLDPSKSRILGKNEVFSLRTTADSGRENTSVLVAADAAGNEAPPLIFKGRNIWDQWITSPSESFPGTT